VEEILTTVIGFLLEREVQMLKGEEASSCLYVAEAGEFRS
jgi:hypothetical protein